MGFTANTHWDHQPLLRMKHSPSPPCQIRFLSLVILPIPLRMWRPPPSNYFAPFSNASTFLLTSWFYNSKGTISFNEVDKLVQEVIRHEDFNAANFGPEFLISCELKQIDKDQISMLPRSSDPLPFRLEDGWMESSISIPVPCDGFKCLEADAP